MKTLLILPCLLATFLADAPFAGAADAMPPPTRQANPSYSLMPTL